MQAFEDQTLVITSHKRHYKRAAGDRRVHVTGGFVRLTDEIARHFGRVLLCVPTAFDRDQMPDRVYRANVEFCPLPFYEDRKELLRWLPRITQVMYGVIRRADIVYAMGPGDMGVLGLTLARLQGKPLFMSLDTDRAYRVRVARGEEHPTTWVKWFIYKHLLYRYIRALGGAKPTFVTGDMFMGTFPAWHQWIKTTLASDEMPPFDPPPPWCDGRELHVVFAGRLAPEKNIPTLLRAAHRLNASGAAVRVSVIGETGPAEEALKRLCADEQWSFVDFVGRVPRPRLIASRFLGADVLVLPSKEERQGKVLLEAMACSIPVVAACAGGIPSVIEDEQNGLLFDPASVEALAAQLRRLRSDEALRERIVEKGYAFARQHALDREVEKMMRVLERELS